MGQEFYFQWVGLGHGSEVADLRKTDVVYITTYACTVTIALLWEAIIQLFENLQFYDWLIVVRCMWVGLGMNR